MPSAGFFSLGLRGQLVDEPAQPIVVHRGQGIAEMGEELLGVAAGRQGIDGRPIGRRVGRRLGRHGQIAVPLSGERGHGHAELVGHLHGVMAVAGRLASGRGLG